MNIAVVWTGLVVGRVACEIVRLGPYWIPIDYELNATSLVTHKAL